MENLHTTQKTPPYDSGLLVSVLKSLIKQHPKTGKRVVYKELAEYLGVKQQSVSSWANGTTIPDTKHIVPIAEFFGVSCDYLLGNTEYMSVHEAAELMQVEADNEDVSRYAIGIYRYFIKFADLVDKINAHHGTARLDKPMIAGFPFSHILSIITAYYSAIENAEIENLSYGELIERFLSDIKKADNSGVFIKFLLEETR